MIYLIKNGNVFTPYDEGVKDILIVGNQIGAIEENITLNSPFVEVIDAKGCMVVPGFIDSHVHICGGGGEGGFKTRTPEIALSDLIQSGITSVVGVLGTDGVTRTMSNLLAKAYSLEEEGLSTYVLTGSYQVPVKTVTQGITDDIILVDKIIGVGEIALSDHRSSTPSRHELSRLTSEARVGGMLSGKAGIVNIHIGDAPNPLALLYDVLHHTTIPITQFHPTHMNRNPHAFEEAKAFVKAGGSVDFTTSTVPQFIEEGEIPAPRAVKEMIKENTENINKITLSSDGQGSLPEFDEKGNLKGLTVAKPSSLLECVQKMVEEEAIPIPLAIQTVTSNPAGILKLRNKGQLKKGYDADVLILTPHFKVNTLFCRGKLFIDKGKVLIKDTFNTN